MPTSDATLLARPADGDGDEAAVALLHARHVAARRRRARHVPASTDRVDDVARRPARRFEADAAPGGGLLTLPHHESEDVAVPADSRTRLRVAKGSKSTPARETVPLCLLEQLSQPAVAAGVEPSLVTLSTRSRRGVLQLLDRTLL